MILNVKKSVVSQESQLAHEHNNMNCHILCMVVGRLNYPNYKMRLVLYRTSQRYSQEINTNINIGAEPQYHHSSGYS